MINEQGYLTYLYTSELQLSLGILPDQEFFERIILLFELCDDKNHKEHLQTFLDYPIEKIIEHRKVENKDEDLEKENTELLNGNGTISKNAKQPEGDILFLLTKMPGILKSNWEFHKSDADYWPSVPHAHLEIDHGIKLDAYRGNTYNTNNNNKELKRESKQYIASLWNDEKFRKHSIETINYFINNNPDFRWFEQRGIIFPRRIPKRR